MGDRGFFTQCAPITHLQYRQCQLLPLITRNSPDIRVSGTCTLYCMKCHLSLVYSLSKDSIFIYFNLCISFFEDILFIYAFLFSNSFFFYASPVSHIIFCIKLMPISLILHCSLTAKISISQQCGVRKREEGRLLGLRKGYLT